MTTRELAAERSESHREGSPQASRSQRSSSRAQPSPPARADSVTEAARYRRRVGAVGRIDDGHDRLMRTTTASAEARRPTPQELGRAAGGPTADPPSPPGSRRQLPQPSLTRRRHRPRPNARRRVSESHRPLSDTPALAPLRRVRRLAKPPAAAQAVAGQAAKAHGKPASQYDRQPPVLKSEPRRATNAPSTASRRRTSRTSAPRCGSTGRFPTRRPRRGA